MRISDWSSDVCSSDLRGGNADLGKHDVATEFSAGHKEMSWLLAKKGHRRRSPEGEPAEGRRAVAGTAARHVDLPHRQEIGRPSVGERVFPYVWILVCAAY